MYTKIKSTVTGLTATVAALMLSYAFGEAPSSPLPERVEAPAEMVIITLSAEDSTEGGADADQGRDDRRHMSRLLATPYLSVGRLLPRRGS